MKNKTKLLMTLISMCLVITLGVIGILAVKKLDLNIGGSVNFTAEGVAFEVSAGKFYTDANHTSEYTGLVTNKMLGFSTDTNTPYNDIKANVESWSGLALNLDERGDAYLHFTVKNNMANTLYIAVSVDNGTQDDNKNISIKTIVSPPTIAGNTTEAQDFVFHFDIKDTDVNASLTNFKIDLTFSLVATQVEVNSQGQVQGDLDAKYTGVKYVIENNKVIVQNNNASGDIVIASSVVSPSGDILSVTEIPANAFEGRINITSVVITDGVITIGDFAFYQCANLISVNIPNSVTSIGEQAFKLSGLTSINIPSSLKTMGFGAFACTNITTLKILEGVTEIASNGFMDCHKLISVELPDTLTKIGFSAFGWCNKLTSIELPSSLTTLDASAFNDCISLKSIKIPDGITKIDDIVFAGCTALTYVGIPDSVQSIGMGAFSGCTSLSSIVIPSSVSSIGEGAFDSCSALEIVEVQATTPPSLSSDTFANIPSDTQFVVPKNSLLTYQGKDYWKDLNLVADEE